MNFPCDQDFEDGELVDDGVFCWCCEHDVEDAYRKKLTECPNCAWPLDYETHSHLVAALNQPAAARGESE